MKWQFEKFQGDMAIYAICPKCGFDHPVSTISDFFELKINSALLYNYCPMCGEKDETDHFLTEEQEVVWNQRKAFAQEKEIR